MLKEVLHLTFSLLHLLKEELQVSFSLLHLLKEELQVSFSVIHPCFSLLHPVMEVLHPGFSDMILYFENQKNFLAVLQSLLSLVHRRFVGFILSHVGGRKGL